MPEPSPEEERDDRHPGDRGEPTKDVATILQQQINEGARQLRRPAGGLFLSALSAGLDIGFGPLLVAAVIAMSGGSESLAERLVLALLYSVGFLIVILGRSELFTEHTAQAVLPVLARECSVADVARLWGLVYAGNIAGSIIFSAAAAPLGLSLGIFDSEALHEMASSMADVSWLVLFGSAVGAGWLMGLLSWLVTAARETTAQVLIIILVAGGIGFLGLHHSIAGSTEVLLGVYGADVTFGDWLRFLGLATAGNAVGGVILVSLLKFGHAMND